LGDSDTIAVGCFAPLDQPGHTTSICGFNGTGDQATNSGSGFTIGVGGLFAFSMRLSTFSRNYPANCLVFMEIQRRGSVTGVNLINNTCLRSQAYGLVYVIRPVMFDRCVFWGNTFDKFIGGGQAATLLKRCVFDFAAVSTVKRMSLRLENCIFGARRPLFGEKNVAAARIGLGMLAIAAVAFVVAWRCRGGGGTQCLQHR
jgi:hypothetical protein